jgi:Type I phosphodiesterase / nucleotide pyrophosphatase
VIDDLQSPVVSSPPTPMPILPDYHGACLSNLVPALIAGTSGDGEPLGAIPEWIPSAVEGARQVVLLVIDGLGWNQLRSRPDLAPTLCGAFDIDRAITSVVPTTTACALTSIATGTTPAEHGVMGYRLATDRDEIMNVLRWSVGTTTPRDVRQSVPAAAFQPFPPFPGATRAVPVVSRGEFGGTGFTACHLGDSPLFGYKVASSLLVHVRHLVAAGESFIYAYYDGIDKVAHEHGLGDHYDEEIRAVDRLVSDLVESLPPDAALVITADHGQVDIGPRIEVLGPEIMSAVRFLSGEGRFRWIHARPGASDDAHAAASEHYGDRAWVVDRQQLIDESWFGGPLRPGVVERLGDIALIPHAPIAFLDPADTGESRLAARHGSLTADEMLVPLVALTGRGSVGGNISV